MNIVLGVTGSISAYKAADIANRLYKDGHDVHVAMTDGAEMFITPMTLQTLSKNKVYTEGFEEADPSVVAHIDLAEKADLVLIAPATANVIGKIAGGIADNFLCAVVLAAANQCPIYIAPAMNTHMYENPIVQENIKKLEGFGYKFIEPRESVLACGYEGKGALADVDEICDIVEGALK